jgi:ribosomal protein L37AE/L43A
MKVHLLTAKHRKKKALKEGTNHSETKYECSICSKHYKFASGLWKHENKCKKSDNGGEPTNTNNNNNNEIANTNMFEKLVKIIEKNNEIQTILVEQNNNLMEKIVKAPTLIQQNTINNTMTNNQFNLNVFLNEKCKDAINNTDFISSLKLQVSDFEETGRLGYVEGITKIFLKFLKDYDVEKRPMHCTDIKRETIYVKHNDVWEKENDDKRYLKWAVNAVAQLNFNQHVEWQREHPDCVTNNTKNNHEFMRLITVALGGSEESKLQEKIMKNVLREVVIDKTKKIEVK